MFSYDVKFITNDESICLKNNDLKSFKYETKKKLEDSLIDLGKRNYCERRGGYWRSARPRQLRQLESKLRDLSVVSCEWTNDSLITIVLSTGVIAYITLKHNTLDITQALFDRYCASKLNGQVVTGVVLCKKLILFIHPDKVTKTEVATLITFGKNTDDQKLCQISEREPHLQVIELAGTVRKVDRKVSWCESPSYVRVLVWGSTTSEPAPWSPVLEDHANLHLYQILGQQVILLAYHQLENEVLFAELSHKHDNIVHIAEQSACHKSGASLFWLRYEVQATNRATKLSSLNENATRVSLPAPAKIARRSTCDQRLLVACIDASIHVIHHVAGLTHSTRAGFIATDVRWAGELIVAAEDAGRLQCFDRALSLLHHHSKCLDLTSYMRDPKRVQLLATRSFKGGPVILAALASGPLTLLRITHGRLLTAWLRSNRLSNAVSLLRALDWGEEGAECLRGTGEIVSSVLRKGLTEHGESGVQAALGTFLAPPSPLPAAATKYAPPLHDLARKFFHHLLRRGRIEKALSLAVDLAAWDLFCDARWAAKRLNVAHLAEEAGNCAAYYARLDRTDSDCSDSCSQCSSHSYTGSEEESSTSNREVKTKPPPLPRVPLPTSSILTLPITHNDTYTTNSIRPNLHQYLDRDNTIWSKNIRDDSYLTNYKRQNSMRNNQNIRWNSVDNVLNAPRAIKSYPGVLLPNPGNNISENVPQSHDERITAHFKQLYQTELQEEENNEQFNNVPSSNSNFNERYRQEQWPGNKPEKNKVKFSDKVTVAVVPERADPEPARELAASLPICAPHRYLAAFEPQPQPGTTLDYVEV